MSPKVIVSSALGFFGFLVAITVLGGSWYTVDQGERGVILRNGAISGTAEPGLGFKMPLIDGIVTISTQSQKHDYHAGGPGLAAYSKDQQPALIRLSVNYRADPSLVGLLYERYGSLEGAVSRLVDPQVYEELKNVFGRFNAITAVQDRARLNAEIETAVRAGVGLDKGIIIESVQIENIDFSAAYEESIEQRMLAEVEVEKVRQNAMRAKIDAEIVVTQAQGAADSRLAQAKAEAEAIRLTAEADAYRIKSANEARMAALRENPRIVEYLYASQWNGALPTTMIPGGAVPFINLTPEK